MFKWLLVATMVYGVVRSFQAALKYRGGWKGLLEHMYTVSSTVFCFVEDHVICGVRHATARHRHGIHADAGKIRDPRTVDRLQGDKDLPELFKHLPHAGHEQKFLLVSSASKHQTLN